MTGQSPDQEIDLLVEVSPTGRERGEWQPRTQLPCAIHCTGGEPAQVDQMATEASGDLPTHARFEHDATAEPRRDGDLGGPSYPPRSGSAQARALRCAGGRD